MKYWSLAHQDQIEKAIQTAKNGNPNPYAVFDADNTIWKYDLIESLLAWMSVRGLIKLDGLDASLLPFPVREDETPLSYYDYLCEINISVGYLWAAQIFSGYQLRELKDQVDAMLENSGVIQAPMPNGQTKAVFIARIFPAQKELISYLQQNDVAVWVVSASLEEVVRMVASDPRYGLNIPPERVIGVNLALEKPNGEVEVGALEREAGKRGLDYYFSKERMTWRLGTYPFAPLTWYAGKVAAIQEWIDPAQRPILVAGDSPNDFYMQFYAAADQDAVRLRVCRKDSHTQKLKEEKERRHNSNVNPDPEKGWIVVESAALGLGE